MHLAFTAVDVQEKTGVARIDTNGEIFTIAGPQEVLLRFWDDLTVSCSLQQLQTRLWRWLTWRSRTQTHFLMEQSAIGACSRTFPRCNLQSPLQLLKLKCPTLHSFTIFYIHVICLYSLLPLNDFQELIEKGYCAMAFEDLKHLQLFFKML